MVLGKYTKYNFELFSFDRLIADLNIALNSGKVWPKQGIIKYPGKITVSFLKAIEPGLNKDDFIKKLENEIYKEIKNIS